MSGCPFPHALTIDLATLPARIQRLPVLRGFPVPWFVAKVSGEFDFRLMDPRKLRDAVQLDLCWVCGEPLGKFKSFVIGPMCGINRTNGEPPSHRECAQYSARHCPFLTRPNMKRREDDITRENEGNVSGFAIKRNPGCCAVWTVKGYEIFSDGKGGVLFHIGEPLEVEWYAQGRQATYAEVIESIDSGIHHLEAMCLQEATPELQASALQELQMYRSRLAPHLPTRSLEVAP